MAFTELLKKEMRRKSAFRCCACRQMTPSLEVHHIVPQEVGGPDVAENAAPLCPTCHSDFGGNEEKRTRMREMRDVWFETVEVMYGPRDLALAESIGKEVSNIGENLPKIKDELKAYVETKINELTPQNALFTISSIMSSAVANPATPEIAGAKKILGFRDSAYWEEGDEQPFCSKCWEVDQKAVHMHPMGNPAFYQCPNCKSGSVRARPDRDDDPPSARVFYPRINPAR